MKEKIEYILATVAIAFGSQWAIRFFQNYKTKSQVKKDDIDALNEIIEQLRKEIGRLEIKVNKLEAEKEEKEKLYREAYKCKGSIPCPILDKLNNL